MKRIEDRRRSMILTDESAEILERHNPNAYTIRASNEPVATHVVCAQCLEIVPILRRHTDCPHF